MCIITVLLIGGLFRVAADSALNRALEQSRYNSDEQREIEQIFAEAADLSIGTGLLLPRVQEAQAKRVPAERLVAALQQEIERLNTARDILLETEGTEALLLDDAAWQRTANLIAWGARKEEIQALSIACAKDAHKYLEASYLFTSVVEWGLDREASKRLVSGVAVSKIDVAEYPGIIGVLINGRRLKMQPLEIADRMIIALEEVDNVRQLERKVLNDR